MKAKFQAAETPPEDTIEMHYADDVSEIGISEQECGSSDSCTSRSEKLRVLTVVPKSWSARKTAMVFGVSH